MNLLTFSSGLSSRSTKNTNYAESNYQQQHQRYPAGMLLQKAYRLAVYQPPLYHDEEYEEINFINKAINNSSNNPEQRTRPDDVWILRDDKNKTAHISKKNNHTKKSSLSSRMSNPWVTFNSFCQSNAANGIKQSLQAQNNTNQPQIKPKKNVHYAPVINQRKSGVFIYNFMIFNEFR